MLDELLGRMEGAFDIHARMWRAGATEPRTLTGKATWSRGHWGRYTREEFTMTVGERVLTGEVYFGPTVGTNRFELVQVDGFNPSMFHVAGAFDVETGTIRMEPVAGDRPLLWVYRLGEGKSFVKEMYSRAGDSWTLASDYAYMPRAGD